MVRIRVFLLALTFLVVGVTGTIAFYYAKGYRFDTETKWFVPQGLLVVDSVPNGAQLYIGGVLETATNATVPLAPGIYDVRIQKEGFLTWEKRLVVEKEIVTKVDAKLFSAGPTLSALTFSGVVSPTASSDTSKVAYVVTPDGDVEKAGLWVIESISLPIGFSRDPKQVTDGDLTEAQIQWSPDSREILLTVSKAIYLLDASEFTPQEELVNITSSKDNVLAGWQKKADKKLKAKLKKLPDALEEILFASTTDIQMSPDENKILYTASGSATIVEDLIKQLPGSSTQKQEREIKDGNKYVYDIKEDRNFRIGGAEDTFYWLPSSAHLLAPRTGSIVIMDYDGTNQQEIYNGSYSSPFAFPYANTTQLLVLTNLGSGEEETNLYSLNLK